MNGCQSNREPAKTGKKQLSPVSPAQGCCGHRKALKHHSSIPWGCFWKGDKGQIIKLGFHALSQLPIMAWEPMSACPGLTCDLGPV